MGDLKLVAFNDGEKFVPAILMGEEGDKDKVYVLQGSEQSAARRAPRDYDKGRGMAGGGMTWCNPAEISQELP
jgi:hypothetical protein